MKKVKLGIIGIGEIAQIAHLPVLTDMEDKFELRAFCDMSKELLSCLGKKYCVEHLYDDAIQMLDQEDLDAVFILSGIYNAALTVEAVKRGIHVFVEKPMALTFSQVDEIIKAKKDTGIHVMVGYMRRFAPAFLQAVEEVKKMKSIKYVRVRDFIGQNHFFTQQSNKVYRFDDIPEELKDVRVNERNRLLTEVMESPNEKLSSLYGLLAGLSSHSTSAMRELLGMPKDVDVAVFRNGVYLTASLDYENFEVVYEMCVDQQRRFDSHIEIFGDDKTIKVQYDTPYLRNLPTKLLISETCEEGYIEKTIRPTYKDPFTCEIESFYETVTKNIETKTSPEDFRFDLEIFQMILRKIVFK